MFWFTPVVAGRSEAGKPALSTALVHDVVFSDALTTLEPSGV
jgi:hypothetical protein